MERLYSCCCGLDVHKQTVVACLLRPADGGQRRKAIRTFGTTTEALRHLADWLRVAGCTHVAMEGSGVYWKPVYNILGGQCTDLLVNAQHIKNVAGRKTDVADSAWIADLLQHGLLRPSVVPVRAQREPRDVIRARTAEVLLAEIGVDMGRFPSAGHLAAWAGMCPGQHESAGKRRKAPAREGNRALRRALTEAARAAARTKTAGRTRLAAQYRRLVVRCGKKKAAVAVGHTILRLVYHLLTHNEPYREPDLSYLDERRRAHTQQRAINQLRALGYEVTITPKEPAA